jgi:putative PIN family toxin of toxin-antitoxin system
MGKKVKVVFDTNVWISIFMKKILSQEYYKILNQGTSVYISKDILMEISKVLTYPKINQTLKACEIDARQILRIIAANSTIVYPKIKVHIIEEDPQDNRILECALAAGAKFIATGDKHLLKLSQFKQTKILTPRELFDYCTSN